MRMKDSLLIHLYQHSRYIWHNAWNELRYRYAGTGMGIFWNVIHPLIAILLYTVIFSWIFPQRARGGGYVLYLTSGLLVWRAFADTIQRGSNAFIEHARYLKRLAIPSEIFVARVALTSTFMLYIYYVLLVPINFLLGNQVSWQIFLLPVLLLFVQSLAFGMTLVLADLRALFPDIGEIIHAFLPLWLWTLPVIYPETVLPEHIRQWLYLNPPYVFLRSIRTVVLHQDLPALYEWIIMGAWLLCVLWIGSVVHRKLQAEVKEAI